jgi:RNA 3'-terminal phosphate cyclase (ATP)
MGVRATIELTRWGFYPAGGGEVKVEISGGIQPLHPIQMVKRGNLQRVGGIAAVANLPAHIPQRMANRARNLLTEAGLQSSVETSRLRGAGPGAGIFLWAEYEHCIAGFTAYGQRGLPAEQVAETACEKLLAHHRSEAPVDPYLADQLILPMALADGESQAITSKVTQHLLTNVWVVQHFLSRDISVQGELGARGTIIVRGGAYD